MSSKKKTKVDKINKPIGIYDPDGLNINPLTITNLYSLLLIDCNKY